MLWHPAWSKSKWISPNAITVKAYIFASFAQFAATDNKIQRNPCWWLWWWKAFANADGAIWDLRAIIFMPKNRKICVWTAAEASPQAGPWNYCNWVLCFSCENWHWTRGILFVPGIGLECWGWAFYFHYFCRSTQFSAKLYYYYLSDLLFLLTISLIKNK